MKEIKKGDIVISRYGFVSYITSIEVKADNIIELETKTLGGTNILKYIINEKEKWSTEFFQIGDNIFKNAMSKDEYESTITEYKNRIKIIKFAFRQINKIKKDKIKIMNNLGNRLEELTNAENNSN